MSKSTVVPRRRDAKPKPWSSLSKLSVGLFLVSLGVGAKLLLLNVDDSEESSGFYAQVAAQLSGKSSEVRTYGATSLTDVRTLPVSQGSDRWRLQGGKLDVQLVLRNGTPPTLAKLRWSGDEHPSDKKSGVGLMDVTTAKPVFVSFAPRGIEPASPCRVSRALVNSGDLTAELQCGRGVGGAGSTKADWRVSAVDLGRRGAALRWHLHLDQATAATVASVQVAMWLPSVAVEGSVDGSPVAARRRPPTSILSIGKHAVASGSSDGKGPDRLVDGNADTEWFASKNAREAWITIDLAGERIVTGVQFQWWGVSSADTWKLESRSVVSSKPHRWVERATSNTASGPPSSEMNVWVRLSGWNESCRFLRLSMSDGHQDPWGFGVRFGLRTFDVVGKDAAPSADTCDLWASPSKVLGCPGAWLALEHPRARCSLGAPTPPQASRSASDSDGGGGGKSGWRLASCVLRLSEHPTGPFEVSGSLGIFEDARQDVSGVSQLRRVFAAYLQEARRRPFGQTLHYNSWYDMASSRDDRSHLHEMTETSCADRIETFNAKLTAAGGPSLDAFLLDDGWDDWDTLWEVDTKRFPSGFAPLTKVGWQWGTRLGVWMSPFGGYGRAGSRRVKRGKERGFETSNGRFSLSGPRYFDTFRRVIERRILEGFALFKFDGLGGGLGQSGGDAFLDDFEAVLALIQSMRQYEASARVKGEQGAASIQPGHRSPAWVSLTIGTWPSPFWLLWGDSIWRDGPDVGQEGVGSPREKWLTFRDAALRRAHERGPLFPLTAFMQHGVVWSRAREAIDMWPSSRSDPVLDFCHEVLTFFLSGTGLQELYLQSELVELAHWQALAAFAALARNESLLLRDAHPIGGSPVSGEAYGIAAFEEAVELRESKGVFWWRNPSEKAQDVEFHLAQVFELPDGFVAGRLGDDVPCWEFHPLRIGSVCQWPVHPQLVAGDRNMVEKRLWGADERITFRLEPFAVYAWLAAASSCGM
eukprot:TRINITY_DN48399_c0_g1_i1.p1 TRINITY_DN48399_c0_g1~~TRINITY_DN48399_c0_g1_i1.p1  ORF type:complete len:984 (-),score=122.34 TRINITY_DN48399_c0_g1_i1:131-3082(-)